MSEISIYDSTVVVLERSLNTLIHILKKASEHPDAASFPDARLHEDMKPLTFQVYTVANFSKKAVDRLTGAPVEEAEDTEQTLPELITKAEKALAVLKTVKPEQLQGKADAQIELAMGPRGTFHMTGRDYVLGWLLPNIFFHLQTTYAILRMKGVPLGKLDYLSSFMPFVTL